MNNRLKEYLSLPYSVVVFPDVTTDNEPCYIASHPELEGCMSHGSTLEEALHNLQEVTELYISALLDKGLEIPLPRGMGISWDIIAPINELAEPIYAIPAVTQPIVLPVA